MWMSYGYCMALSLAHIAYFHKDLSSFRVGCGEPRTWSTVAVWLDVSILQRVNSVVQCQGR